MSIMKIALNSIKCLKCGDVIVSRRRHDFVYCSCKSVAVDGGNDYLKRVGNASDSEEASAYYIDPNNGDKPGEYAGMYLVWSTGGKTNPSTVFFRQSDAIESARIMRKKFGGNWYTAKVESVPTDS